MGLLIMRALTVALAVSIMRASEASGDTPPDGVCPDVMHRSPAGNDDGGEMIAMMEVSMLQVNVKVAEHNTATQQMELTVADEVAAEQKVDMAMKPTYTMRMKMKNVTTKVYLDSPMKVFADAMAVEPFKADVRLTGTAFLTQTGYHMVIVPMLLITCVLAFLANPSTSETIPPGFRAFRWVYLSVWCLCVAADWLQGPYVYALYDAYGFSGVEIAQLYVAGFGSSLAFGCIVGPVADKFGRKRCCIAYCILYILSCMTKHCKDYSILMLGRITGGIATSMLFSCFECWLVSEHLQRHNFSRGLLSYMLGLMFSSMYTVAIVAGFTAQFAADSFKFVPLYNGSVIYTGGYCTPFDMAICCLIVGMVLIAKRWPENYGTSSFDQQESLVESFAGACKVLMGCKSMLLLGLIVACFEGSMYAFVFNWTPALESNSVLPPYGIIFALFMMACRCGASVATVTSDAMKPSLRLLMIFLIGTASFMVAAFFAGKQAYTTFAAFMAFEFCCGVYFPSIGVMKSEVVPEHIRATVYNIYRMPLNAVVVGLLLTDIPMVRCFKLNSSLLALAAVSMIIIRRSRTASLDDGAFKGSSQKES